MRNPLNNTIKQHGVSLLELIIGLAIVSILSVGVVVSVSGYLTNARIRDVMQEFVDGLQQAKTEALTRNANITFSATASSWIITQTSTGTTLASRNANTSESSITISPSVWQVTFDSSGNVPAATDINVSITSPSQGACAESGGSVRCLQIKVISGGSVKGCDPALPTSDARAC